MRGAWSPADDRAVAFYLDHAILDGRARPAYIDPELSNLDRMDRGLPVETPDFPVWKFRYRVEVALSVLAMVALSWAAGLLA